MATLDDHYRTKYQSEAETPGDKIVSIERFPADRFSAAVTAMSAALPCGSHVLELGAGDGTVTASLLTQRADITADVSDTSESRRVGLARRFDGDARVSVVDVNADDVGDRHADAVLMVALIEHLVDPLGAMQRICACLPPGGIVYIDTPNIAKWTRRLRLAAGKFPSTASANEGLTTYGGQPVDLFDEGHLHYFTFRSLSNMLTERCGFTSVEASPYWLGPGPQRVGGLLAQLRPTLFSELAVIARR